jgi:hypothetical protein
MSANKGKSSKSAKAPVRVGGLPIKTKRLAGKHLKNVKGGFTGGVWVAAGDIEGDGVASFNSGATKKGR